jgi:hypothetical protein
MILPKNDPDYFGMQESIAYWWLELEGAVAQREIGFTSAGLPIRCAPAFRNRGVFVGEEVSSRHLAEELSQGDFDEAWQRAIKPLIAKHGNP